jgi:hypothetical protein
MSQNFSNVLLCVKLRNALNKMGINGFGLTLGRIQALNPARVIRIKKTIVFTVEAS